jgi:rabenosyn-5
MSGRKLGGGRILGSGKGLAPPKPAHQRMSSLGTPSEGTVSHSSRESSPLATSPLAEVDQDLGSRVNLENGGPVVTAMGSKLVCPICSEEMVGSLYSLIFWVWLMGLVDFAAIESVGLARQKIRGKLM